MAGSSPPRRSYNYAASSPISEILYTDRNSEARHKQLLEVAKREHDRVLEAAVRALRDHEREQERRQILEQERREEERIRKELELAAERTRLKELQAKKIEIPPAPEAKPETPPSISQTPSAPSARPVQAAASSPFAGLAQGTTSAQQSSSVTSTSTPATVPSQSFGQPTATSSFGQPSANSPFGQPSAASPFGQAAKSSSSIFGTPSTSATNKANPFAAAATTATTTSQPPVLAPATITSSPFSQVQPMSQANGHAVSGALTPAALPTNQAGLDRYQVIHLNLKQLRYEVLEQAKRNQALKDRVGDMRREIRKCVGQLIHGPGGANRQQLIGITTLLREALNNHVRSDPFDPSMLVLEPREPVEGAVHNGPQLPSLFLYLLNIFAKAAIAQFINEASAKPETADPVGVTVAAVFSEPDFLWRGRSLIDMLLAKFRVVCPVLFGYRGNEKYEEGRRRLGWLRDGDSWVPEQQHIDRMTGLGAGFAAISLRNFSKSKKRNPFPPRNYWAAMSRIVNTPSHEISNTQAIVLKAMIQNYESKFMDAYGTAARAALRLALVDFPAKAPVKTPAIESLQVLAQLLKKETGLGLA